MSYVVRKASLFIVMSMLLVLVSACGSSSKETSTSETNAAASETRASTETEKTDASAAEANTLETRNIKHVLGELPITGVPNKIVVLEWTYAEDLLALGIQPAGVADIENMKKNVALPIELSADVQDVGTRQEPNLETIAALEPDLIIGVKFRHEAAYDQFNAIAPTLIFDPYPAEGQGDQYQEMVDTFKTIADAAGKSAEAEAVLADLQKSYDDAKSKLAAAGKDGRTFVLSMPWVDQNAVTFRLSTSNGLASKVLEQIGLKNGYQSAQFEAYGFTTSGVEALQSVQDADYINITRETEVADMLGKNAVWTGLTFVKENRLFALGGDAWPYGGPHSAKIIVERAVQALTGQ